MRAALLLVILAGCVRQDPPTEAAPFATIDGQQVTRSEFVDALMEAQGDAFFPRYVDAIVVARAAAAAGVTVTDAEVTAAVDEQIEDAVKRRFAGNRKAFEEQLQAFGLTEESWRRGRASERRTYLLAERLLSKTTFEGRVKALFEQRFGKDGVQRTARHILVATSLSSSRFYTRDTYDAEKTRIQSAARQRAEAIRRALVEGAALAKIAADSSDDFSAKKGGALEANWSGRFGKAFDDAVRQLDVGEISPVVEGRRGYHVAQVVGVRRGARYEGRHIFVKASGADGFEAALEAATSIHARIEAGEDMSQLARSVSDDPVTRAKAGDLGTFSPGRLGADVDAVLETMPIGQVSRPLKVADGYQIIELKKRAFVPAQDRKLVSHVLVSTEYAKVKARRIGAELETRAKEKAEKLLADARAEGADFAALAKTHSEDELTRRNGGALPRHAERYGDAFQKGLEALKPGDTAIVQSKLGFHVMRLESVAKSDFEKVRAELEAEVRKQTVPEKEVRAFVKQMHDKAAVERL